MLEAATLKGLWAGMLVPWTPADTLDEARYRRNLRRCCAAGAHGVYTHGTTGEFYTQTFEEWHAVAAATIEECHAAGTPVQIGVTDTSTRGSVRKARIAAELGADAIQTALPFWLAMSLEEAIGFYRDLAAAVPGMPIVVYGTGRAKTPTTIELLRRTLDAGVPLIGCKYAGPVEELVSYIKACPEISFLLGEPHLASGMAAGARGSCSVHIYVCPRYMLRYYDLAAGGCWDEAFAIQQHVQGWRYGPAERLIARGLQDSALDRTFARAAGFIEIDLECRPPYRSATQEELADYITVCQDEYPEFLYDIPQ